MKMKDVVSLPSKPSRILRSDFPLNACGRSRSGARDDDDEDAARNARHAVSRQPRQIKTEPYLRAKRQGPSSASDLGEWVEEEEEPPERQFRVKGEPDGWEEAEQEAQDYIDAEQEAQRMLGLDEILDDFRT